MGTIAGNPNTTWAYYAYNYTATKPVPTLIFGFTATSSVYLIIDDVSVVDKANSSNELLINHSFESSPTIPPTAWTPMCSQSCSGGATNGIVVNSTCRTGNCYRGRCSLGSNEYLAQPFPATVGRNYTVSFWFLRFKYGTSTIAATLYIGII